VTLYLIVQLAPVTPRGACPGCGTPDELSAVTTSSPRSQPGRLPSLWYGGRVRHQAEAAAAGGVDPSGWGIGSEHQVREVHVLHDLPAAATCVELLALLRDVQTNDLNGGADQGGRGGERDLLDERLVEDRRLLGEVVEVAMLWCGSGRCTARSSSASTRPRSW
jgi:hypothetical protein